MLKRGAIILALACTVASAEAQVVYREGDHSFSNQRNMERALEPSTRPNAVERDADLYRRFGSSYPQGRVEQPAGLPRDRSNPYYIDQPSSGQPPRR
jgi:hypothetical protein